MKFPISAYTLAIPLMTLLTAIPGHGADKNPVSRQVDSSQIMERVQLVGVIAGDKSTNGIAVIRDAHTGKTYAIKTGDALPGVAAIKLQTVKRELAVFFADGKEYSVRLTLGGYSQPAEDEADLNLEPLKAPEHGLFEKWYSHHLGEGADLSEKNPSDSPKGSTERMVTGSKPAGIAKRSEDKGGAEADRVADYLRSSTAPRSVKKAREAAALEESGSASRFTVDPHTEVEE